MLSRPITKYLLAICLVAALVVVGVGVYVYSDYFLYSSPEDVTVEIPKGPSLNEIAGALEESGAIKSAKAFVGYVVVHNAERSLKAGEYELKAGSGIGDVVDKIVKGEVVLREITIPEGLTVPQTAELLDEKGVVTKEAFLKAAGDREFIRAKLGRPVDSVEGYLYPDTYKVEKGITAKELVARMIARHREVFRAIDHSGVDLSSHEIVTLASIIEKETAVAEERPIISAVLHNRLKLGMRLECDPTVIYGMGEDFHGNLRKKDLQLESPYNTYVIYGLPPGPISNPGKGSLEAAVNPAPVDYLYFVSRGDGTHKFSSRYREHLRAVRKYQKRRRR